MGCGSASKVRADGIVGQSTDNPNSPEKCANDDLLATNRGKGKEISEGSNKLHSETNKNSLHDECTNSRARVGLNQGHLELCIKGHKMFWYKRLTSIKCSLCKRRGNSGYYCKSDSYSICTGTCRIIKKSQFCPNGHRLVLHKLSYEKTCDICSIKDNQIFECKSCDFNSCHYCGELQYRILDRSSKSTARFQSKSRLLQSNRREPEVRRTRGQRHTKLMSYSLQKPSAMSRENLREMSGVLKSLLRQNANMQASLSSVIDGNQK